MAKPINTRKREGTKTLKCMNHDPENSKWGDWAPEGGCDETVEVDQHTSKVLCWKCTSRTVTQPGTIKSLK